MATKVSSAHDDLYGSDFAVWARRQADALRARRFDDLDVERLAEEVEDLRRSEKKSIRSHVERIVEHLLKLEHSPTTDPRRGWRDSVRAARDDAETWLTPTFRRELADELDEVYAKARKRAAASLRDHGEDAAARALPSACPYALDDILREDWWPSAQRA